MIVHCIPYIPQLPPLAGLWEELLNCTLLLALDRQFLKVFVPQFKVRLWMAKKPVIFFRFEYLHSCISGEGSISL